jgi:glyceraldehyde 3-phosphate dehydrogenase
MVRLALNGCGRIGKNIIRALLDQKRERELIAINLGPTETSMIAYTIQYDSILGPYRGTVAYENGKLILNSHTVELYTSAVARELPWKALDIDWAIDASGRYTTREKAQEHLEAGARSVLITAPMEGDDVTIILGVNESTYDRKRHTIVSLGSCTTNAVVPLVAACKRSMSITAISMTTTHAYTNSQSLLDGVARPKDPRRSRAAGLNIVPSATGALNVLQKIIPEFANKVVGHALRVPVPNGSIIDLVMIAEHSVARNELHASLIEFAQQHPNIMGVTRAPLVSSDIVGDPHSVVVDLEMTTSCGTLCKVFGWYDNEYGYSRRVCDFIELACAQSR